MPDVDETEDKVEPVPGELVVVEEGDGVEPDVVVDGKYGAHASQHLVARFGQLLE